MLTIDAHKGSAFCVAFSGDGKRLVTAGQDRFARVWSAAKGMNVASLEGHQADAYGAAFTPSGKSVVSSSQDKTVRVWEAR